MEEIVYCDHIPCGVAIKIENNVILIGTKVVYQDNEGDVATA